MLPQLVESGFIRWPFDHMCEGLEKSNHRANRDFQTKMMRGGGKIHHNDPLFLEEKRTLPMIPWTEQHRQFRKLPQSVY